MTLGKKLMICIAGMLAAIVGLAGAGWYSNQSAGSALSYATGSIGTRLILGGEMNSEVVSAREAAHAMLMCALAHDARHASLNRDEARRHLGEAKARAAAIWPLLTLVKGRALIASINAGLDQYSAEFERVAGLVDAGKTTAAFDLNRDAAGPVGEHVEQLAHAYIDVQKGLLADTAATGAQGIVFARWLAIIFITIGTAVVGLITVVVRRITRQLQVVTASLSEGASQIAAGSTQVSSSSQSLAQGASEQASALEETSASAEEVSSMTRQNAANTGQVTQLMDTVDRRVAEGNSTLALMIRSMQEINTSSGKISKIIKVIDEIAFQTNILALNAAVEAARAGAAGAGFAVVADEVRNLAQRSAQAAKDTAALIEESIATSNEGSSQLQKVADVVGSITDAAAKVKVLVDEVNVGSQEQAKGIEEIARSLTEMDKVTQSTAAAAEESASASQEMSAQAQALAHLVEELRTMAGRAA